MYQVVFVMQLVEGNFLICGNNIYYVLTGFMLSLHCYFDLYGQKPVVIIDYFEIIIVWKGEFKFFTVLL